MSKEKKQPLEKYISDFRQGLSGAVASIHAAARAYTDAISAYGDKAIIAFHKAYPGVSAATWERMRLIGTDSAIPEIIFLTDKTALRIARLPIDRQKEMFKDKEKVEVVTGAGNVVKKPLSQLTARDEDIVFKETGEIRTIAEMRQYQAEKNAATQELKPYDIQGNVLVIHRACRLGKKELEAILREMR